MTKIVISVTDTLYGAIESNLDSSMWSVKKASLNTFVDVICEDGADFLLIQVTGIPARYRAELMRLYKSGLAPHIILFSLGDRNLFSTSTNLVSETDEFKDTLHELQRTILLSLLQTTNTKSGQFSFIECNDIERRAKRFAHEEHLREIISGVTNQQYKDIVKEHNINLSENGQLLIITKAMPYDYFDDYTHNRRVYYMLDELKRQNILAILSRFAGGEYFEASKNSNCILINDLNIASARKYNEEMNLLLEQLHTEIDDGMTSFFIGRKVTKPDEFNAAYRECVNAKRMRMFYSEEKILPVKVLKQKKENPDLDKIYECLSWVSRYNVSTPDEDLEKNINRMFLDIIKPSANITMYYYCCSALNVHYDSFCGKYDIEPERRSMSRCFDKYVTVEEIAKHYINIFENAKNNVLKFYDSDSFQAFQMISFLKNNYQREISLNDLADYIGLSPSYTSKCFKERIGQTFSDYLTSYRIDRAKELLEVPGHKRISDIASEVGYSNAQFFARMFRQKTGISPTDYANEKNRK